jgi:multicomponent Na+:H+ antiporter subunit B
MRPRAMAMAAGAAGLGTALVWAVTGLPAFGGYAHAYGLTLDRVVVSERHVSNIVSAIVFDYRGTDTMIEEFILFSAVMAVALLLRDVREDEAERAVDEERSDGVRAGGRLAVGATIVVGLTVVAHGYITPGGGFQGGVVVAAGLALVYLSSSLRAFSAAAPTSLLDAAEGVGATTYVAVGVATLAAAGAFLVNVLPLGVSGTLASGGTIALLNAAVGLEVTAAFSLVTREFLEELALERAGR